MLALNFLLFAVELVYQNIFTRPLLIEIAVTTGGDALTDFWSVALHGILNSILPLIFMMVPFGLFAFAVHKDIFQLKQYKVRSFIENAAFAVAGVSLSALVIIANYNMDTEFYDEYQGLYAPELLVRDYGILPLFERQFLGNLLVEKEVNLDEWEGGMPTLGGNDKPGSTQGGTSQNPGGTEDGETETPGPVIDTSPNVLDIDFDALTDKGNKDVDELVQIMQGMSPSNKNAYTGMFEGYNLIYITAEGFSPYAVSEEITPTLYKMLNSGVVAEDYYVPLWSTSTTDGEYVNLIGQIPDGQHSFKKSAGYESDTKKYTDEPNSYPYSLAAYFEAEGVKSYAYHNNSLSYYDRYITHPNIGYQFKAAKLGSCSDDYKSWLFEMEHSNYWPTSDYEMMVSTIPEWINEDRFHAYYMSISGHAAYTFVGNKMASINKDVVAHLDCSEEMKAYIACNYELEKAMAYLVEELEKAGKLSNTVIVLSADHHPYGLTNPEETLEEFTGEELNSLTVQKNCLIIWNSEMEKIVVDKPCSSLDLLPTIYNLFGFEYDSRIFAGRDILSDSPAVVVFSNKSFITDYVIYDASTKKATPRNGAEITDEYVNAMKDYVKIMFKYSAGILRQDFHAYVYDAQVNK